MEDRGNRTTRCGLQGGRLQRISFMITKGHGEKARLCAAYSAEVQLPHHLAVEVRSDW